MSRIFSYVKLYVSVFTKYKRSISVNFVALKFSEYELKKSVRISRSKMKVIGDPNLLSPPETIRGLKILNKILFNKKIDVPIVTIDNTVLSKILPYIKKYFLKMENLKPIQVSETNGKYALLNPLFVKKWSDIDEEDRNKLNPMNINESNFKIIEFTLGYDNWRADELLKSVLPDDKTSVAGFSQIGHIVHVNLKEHVLDYREIIGEILHDKISGCQTVVNKLDKIDNTYRNFQMEVLYGENDMLVQVKENNCIFKFDFSLVYWNPRLSTEHKRITDMLKAGDVLYDIFAGVGPFSIPAAKNNCMVLANDLNPESYKWLKHNGKLNKIKEHLLYAFNKDGRDFIRNEMKMDLQTRLSNADKSNVHIVMNLPAIATEFLNEFSGLYKPDEIENMDCDKNITVHVYCFAKGERPFEIAKDSVEKGLGHKLSDNLIEITSVRTVSNFKEMIRISFKLTKDILTSSDNAKRKLEEADLVCDAKKCNETRDLNFG